MLDKILSLLEWIYQSIKGMTVKVDYISDVKDGSTAEAIEEFTDTDKAVSARSAAVLKAYTDSQVESSMERIEEALESLSPDQTAALALATQVQNIKASIAPAWTASTDYSVADLVQVLGVLYKCTTTHTSGSSFDNTKWTATTLWNELSNTPIATDID